MTRHVNRRFAAVLAITSAAWFLFALDRMIVATALPAIRTALDARVEDLEWTVDAFTLAFAALLLSGAALGERFGRRRVLAVGIAVFTAGSAVAGTATSVPALVLARAAQGAGGALFVPLALTVLSAAAPAGRRGAALGAWGGIGALGGLLGPLVGGVLAAGPGWPWIFWLNVPLGIVLVPLAARLLPADPAGLPRGRIDGPGLVLGSTGLLGVVGGVVEGDAAGWTSGRTLLAIGLGGALLAGFVAWERRAPAPMLPLRLFTDRAFAAASIASLLMYASLFGSLFLVAQLLQAGGVGSAEAGWRMLPIVGVPFLVSPVAGVLCDRVGARPLMVLAVALQAVAAAWFAVAVQVGAAYPLLVPPMVFMGAGAALFFAPVAATALAAAGPHQQGTASGVATTVREVAIALGVALLASVFAAFGGYGSPERFAAGCVPALWVAAALALGGTAAALRLPRLTSPCCPPSSSGHEASPPPARSGAPALPSAAA